MSSFEAAYQRLQESFRDRCAAEAHDLRAISATGRLEGAPTVAMLHRLAGAAGTFGFEALSVEAARLEAQVRVARVDPSQAQDLLDLLDAAAARTLSATPLKMTAA